MRPLPYVWPYWLIFTAMMVWVFAPEFLVILKARRGASGPQSQDRGSMALILFLTNVGMFAAFPLAALPAGRLPYPRGMFWTGLATTVAGSLLRRHCWRVLGSSFTGNVQAHADQAVVERGAYRFVRHPSYSGAMLVFLGIGISLGSWISFAILFVSCAIAYGYRVAVEERALAGSIGDSYRAYMRRSKRFVPFVF